MVNGSTYNSKLLRVQENIQFSRLYRIGRFSALFIAMLLFICIQNQQVTAQEAFATVSVSPRQAYIYQPIKVSISVYSSTWFSKPIQFDNLKVEHAFIVPFTRTVSGIHYIDGNKYAGLQFYFLVFPYELGSLEIPKLNIVATIPPEGDYIGVEHNLSTKAQSIEIQPLPKSIRDEVWMVADALSLKEQWNPKMRDTFEVGDVLTREIEIFAKGALPSFIPSLEIANIEGVSIYHNFSKSIDKSDDNSVNGERIESFAYLIEQEGAVTIPALELSIFHPIKKRIYSYKLPKQTIWAVPNLDLELLETLRDSLAVVNPPLNQSEKDDFWTIYRTKITSIAALLFITALLLYLILKGVKIFKRKRALYLKSERYLLRGLKRAARSGDEQAFVRQLYTWYDFKRSEKDALSPFKKSNISAAEIGQLFINIWGYGREGKTSYNLKVMFKKIRESR